MINNVTNTTFLRQLQSSLIIQTFEYITNSTLTVNILLPQPLNIGRIRIIWKNVCAAFDVDIQNMQESGEYVIVQSVRGNSGPPNCAVNGRDCLDTTEVL
jgi:hypothetical protein